MSLFDPRGDVYSDKLYFYSQRHKFLTLSSWKRDISSAGTNVLAGKGRQGRNCG